MPDCNHSAPISWQSFEVKRYHGDGGAPQWLNLMDGEIDRVAHTSQWLPTWDKDGGFFCSTPDGGVRPLTMNDPVGK
jgi:hypothetical protein